MIFSHITLGVNDLESAIAFYDEIMAVLGHSRHSTGEAFAGYGHPENAQLGIDSLWILTPIDGQVATGGNGTNIALLAPDRQAVDICHKKALKLGAVDDGAPGIRAEAHPNFYAAYFRDFDGNKIVVVCHEPE